MQKTLSQSIKIKGIGLHSGLESTLVFKPADENSGIVFVRSDLSSNNEFPALYSHVVDTRNCTCLGNADKQIVSTIEHIMATLYILGIDNARIEVNQPEVPIMDGSAKVFYEILKNVPLKEQNAPRKILQVKKAVKFADDKGGEILLEPNKGFDVHFEISRQKSSDIRNLTDQLTRLCLPHKLHRHARFAKNIRSIICNQSG